MATELNGWNVQAMTDAVEGVRDAPETGNLTWTSRVAWDGGFGLDVRTQGIGQMGAVMERHFTLRGDHPPELLGRNTGPTAIETQLAALGACRRGPTRRRRRRGGSSCGRWRWRSKGAST